MTQAAQPTPRVISGLTPEAPSARVPGATVPGAHVPGALPVLDLDKRTYSRALDCVHCGLCLPACPTYTQNGLEADSPRGRIYLMKGLADGQIQATESVIRHLDLCLDCRACETACPSGVVYHELIEESRAKLAQSRRPTIVERMIQTVFFRVMPHPTRLKLALLPMRVLQNLGLWSLLVRSPLTKLLPPQFQKMQQMLPPRGAMWERSLASFYPARSPDGTKKATIGFMSGCIGSVMFQTVNRQTIELLQLAGCDVVVPKAQGCCGAIHHHGGQVAQAEAFARGNIDAFLPQGGPGAGGVDFIVNNIAGCGAMLKDYAHLLRDDPTYSERAKAFQQRIRDISEVLLELGLPGTPRRLERTISYHHACHLAHAQKVTEPPLKLLSDIPGLTIVPLVEADMCCGAAGTYNLSQPQMARDLAKRKIDHIRSTGARLLVTGNVGCAMQIQSEADRLGVDLHVTHPVSLLHEAYIG
jgi:glycolate oxidase iron-sulfur subunit